MRTHLVSSLPLAAMLAGAVSANAAPVSGPLCRAIADRYEALMARNSQAANQPTTARHVSSAFYPESPIPTLAADPKSGLTFVDPIIKSLAYSQAAFTDAAAHLPQPFTLSKDLATLLGDQNSEDIELDRLPNTPVHVMTSEAGTAHCFVTNWFTVNSGSAQPIDAPDWDGDGDCGNSRYYGVLDKTPIAIDDGGGDLGPEMTSDAVVTTWADGLWAPSCTVRFSFEPRFDAHILVNPSPDIDHCTGPACEGLRSAALSLVEKVQRDPTTAAAAAARQTEAELTPPQRETFARMKKLWAPDGDAAPADSNAAPSATGPDAILDTQPVALPLVHEGQVYLALVGHITIGWRVYGDYSVKVQALMGDALQDAGDFGIGMAKGRLLKAAVQP